MTKPGPPDTKQPHPQPSSCGPSERFPGTSVQDAGSLSPLCWMPQSPPVDPSLNQSQSVAPSRPQLTNGPPHGPSTRTAHDNMPERMCAPIYMCICTTIDACTMIDACTHDDGGVCDD
ncbi:hypothetical protein Vretimale_9522 [Volvox reticuliferus]|uniref:Uncharacterized protein n=1 Tax=Volvox reticuliferus TaxID=1737510 RepID=A0A8J4GDJ4_9CHLO|nr:hypothetical protein Vretimale_9522 [Volvox reticuliferus]